MGLGVYLRILGAPSVQSCCTLYLLPTMYLLMADLVNQDVCVWLSNLDLSRHHPLL